MKSVMMTETTARSLLNLVDLTEAPSIREQYCYVQLGDLPVGAEFTYVVEGQVTRLRASHRRSEAMVVATGQMIQLGSHTWVAPDLPFAYLGTVPVGVRFRMLAGNHWFLKVNDQGTSDYVACVSRRGQVHHFPGDKLVVLDHQQID